MVNGVIYATAGTRRAVIALEAKSGEMIWMHSVREGLEKQVKEAQWRISVLGAPPVDSIPLFVSATFGIVWY